MFCGVSTSIVMSLCLPKSAFSGRFLTVGSPFLNLGYVISSIRGFWLDFLWLKCMAAINSLYNQWNTLFHRDNHKTNSCSLIHFDAKQSFNSSSKTTQQKIVSVIFDNNIDWPHSSYCVAHCWLLSTLSFWSMEFILGVLTIIITIFQLFHLSCKLNIIIIVIKLQQSVNISIHQDSFWTWHLPEW